tara:strand:- start:446 stop:850 length:405 start_codon:yes stop_codon:yes gene_type:complete
MNNKKVFVSGCFDILHAGHIKLLYKAKTLGNHLYVGIDSDERVKKSKGPNRPVNNEKNRLDMLRSLKIIKSVRIFGSDKSLVNMIRHIKPDILLLGDDWKNKKIIGKNYVKKIVFFKRIKKYSTTKIIDKIENN